jgi:chromosome segregation ATPase
MAAPPPALTESLNAALDRLAQEKAEKDKLQETLATLERTLAERDATVREQAAQLQTYETRIQDMETSLEKWKEDVLGFRDEMRTYEEAQIEVLQEIAVLLRGFKKETESQ